MKKAPAKMKKKSMAKMAKKSPAKMMKKSPAKKPLVGKQANLPKELRDKKHIVITDGSQEDIKIKLEKLIRDKRLRNTLKINASQRQSFLTFLINYFALHLPEFRNPKSLSILHSIFK